MPGIVPTHASMGRAKSVTTVSKCRESIIENADDAGELRRNLLQRSGRLRELAGQLHRDATQTFGEAAQCRGGLRERGERGVQHADGLLQPETAPEIPSRGEVDARAGLVDAAIKLIEQASRGGPCAR